MSAAAAARAKLAGDEDSTMFFPGPTEPPTADSLPGAEPKHDAYQALADLDSFSPDMDTAIEFDPLDDLGGEATPALLAARAEPLASERRPPTAAPGGRAPRSSRPPSRGDGSRSPAKRSASSRSRKRRKPKEPSKLLIGLGVAVVALAGVGAAYLFTQRDDGGTSTSADQVAGFEQAETDTSETTLATEDSPVMEEQTAGPVTGLPPVVIFDEAAIGPVQAGQPYQIAVGDGPSGAQYQLLVDDVADAEPAPELPPVTFAPGRHLLVIEITSPEGDISTDPVVVYAVGEVPGVGYRANLSSVNIDTEGWAEAVRQFDEFVAAGHDQLELMPSSPFPSLVPGYWNIFVDGFDSATGATDYCEATGLTVPDQCFAQRFDPNAPAGG